MIGAPLVQTKLILHGKGLGEINYLLIKLHFQARDTSFSTLLQGKCEKDQFKDLVLIKK
jgi:hypothetical protein